MATVSSTDARQVSDQRDDVDRLLAQRTVFCGPHRRVDLGMYVDAESGTFRATRDTLRLHDGASASTNTYFGRFAASFWQRYTAVDTVRLEFDHHCDDATGLGVALRASDQSGRERPIENHQLSGRGHASFDIRLDRFVDGGAIWFDVDAFDGEATISDVRWTVPAPASFRPSSVVVCTHNRAEDCVTTVLTLAGDPVAMGHVDQVYVVDQGSDRVADRERFSEVRDLLGDKLHYLTQPNLGGAGGFNRGIYELTEGGSTDTNIVVMDDDILCEPESVLRMSSFANSTVQPLIVGAQMLLLSETSRIHVTAEWEALDELKAGRLTAKAKRGKNLLKFKQDARTDAGWNGWWTCLLPAEAVTAESLSLPLFFQWDDIEFGIRARMHGFPTVTLPNAGVWHADFHLKDYDDWSRYFSWRNALIVAAIHTPFDGKHYSRVVAEEIGQHIVSMQYGLAATFLLAVRDFMAGPSILDDGGQSKLAELQALRSRFPDTVRRPAHEVGAASDPNTRISAKGHEPKEHRLTEVLLKRVAKQYLGRVSSAPVSISADDARWWHVSLFDNAVVTDSSQGAVRVRKRDKEIAAAQLKELFEVCRDLRRDADRLQAEWTRALPDLTSRENWKRLFDGE
ncbi:glycosyltransferase [Williamsia deligens]